MKDVKQLYPEISHNEDAFWECSNYNPILEEIGTILIQVDDNDYQGDSRILYEKNGKYGYLIFGWGSCSGCDALQACRDVRELQSLADSLENSVKWFDSLDVLKEYFKSKDWELEYSWHAEETKDFITKVINYDN